MRCIHMYFLFDFQQIPSEHLVDGKQYPGEIQIGHDWGSKVSFFSYITTQLDSFTIGHFVTLVILQMKQTNQQLFGLWMFTLKDCHGGMVY